MFAGIESAVAGQHTANRYNGSSSRPPAALTIAALSSGRHKARNDAYHRRKSRTTAQPIRAFVGQDAQPISKERVEQHLSQISNEQHHKKAWFWHAHVMFNDKDPGSVNRCLAFREHIKAAWAGNAHVEVHTYIQKKTPIFKTGGNFEVLFTRELYTDMLTWLQYNRPEEFDIYIHPISSDYVADHSTRAYWLGKPHELGMEELEEAEKKQAKHPKPEADVMMAGAKVQEYGTDIIKE
eukprot:GHRR01001688.1.p1 GENE.GHRR01001688.1~~GHRR01001688.1.p1  ORF type:complete len:238 (+),score=59.15 GHRR01001688.1:418-1131(+)